MLNILDDWNHHDKFILKGKNSHKIKNIHDILYEAIVAK